VSTTLTRQSGSSVLPPDDTPENLHPPAGLGFAPADPDPDPDGPADLERQLARIALQLAEGPRAAHHADMTLAEVRRAIPPTSRRAPGQQRILDAALAYLDEVAEATGMQERRRLKLELFIRALIGHASWGGEGRAPRAVSSPGRDTVCDLIRDQKTGRPLSATGYKRLRRFWEEGGFTAIVREGWTPDLSPGVLRQPGRDHNMTQAHVLCIPRRAEKKARRQGRGPAQPKNGPLSVFSKTDGSPARERDENPENPSAASCCYPSAGERPGEPEGQERTKGSPREGVLLLGAPAQVSDGWWAHLTRPFARWAPASLQYAIDHHPDGRAHVGTAERVRNPAGWLRWRLSHWLNPDGTARPSPAEEAADRARRHRERQAAEHAELGIAARSARIRAANPAELTAPEPQRPWTPAPAAAAVRPGLASLARELHELKQEGRLDDQARAAAVARALQARRAAPRTPQDAPQPAGRATAGAVPRHDPEWQAAVAAAEEAAAAAGQAAPSRQEQEKTP
jgi:hypothetical protein